MKNFLKSSQSGVKIKLRIKALSLLAFPLVSSILRMNGVEVAEADWVIFFDWIAYGASIAFETIGWWRALGTE